MLLLLFLTGLTVLIVVQNTLELLIGLKALPLSTPVSIWLKWMIHILFISMFAAIHTWYHFIVETGYDWCCSRGAHHFLFGRHIFRRIVHNAVYELSSSKKTEYIIVAIDHELRAGADLEFGSAAAVPYNW